MVGHDLRMQHSFAFLWKEILIQDQNLQYTPGGPWAPGPRENTENASWTHLPHGSDTATAYFNSFMLAIFFIFAEMKDILDFCQDVKYF